MTATEGIIIALIAAGASLCGAWLTRRAASRDATAEAEATRAAKASANGVVLKAREMDAEEKFMATLIAQVTALHARMDHYDAERESTRIRHDAERDALREECRKEAETVHAELVTARQERMEALGRITTLTALLEQKGTREWLADVETKRDRSPEGGKP